MGLELSWLVSGSGQAWQIVIAPLIFQNPYNIPWWGLGAVSMIPGFLAAYAGKYVHFYYLFYAL